MQHVSRTLEAAQNALATHSTTSHDETLPNAGFPQTWVSALFKRFQAIYGHKFTSRIDGIEQLAVREWALGLTGLTGRQIKTGIGKCLTRNLAPDTDDWPPTPAEFRAMCLPEKRDPIHRDYIALPRPPQDPSVMESSLANMRAALAGKR
jgi:hypothetical protein